MDSYLVCRNASQAARDAGYSPKTAGAYARQVMNAPEVRAALAKAAEKALTKAEVDVGRVIDELKNIAFGNVADFFDAEGRLLTPRDMPVEVQRFLSSMEVEAKPGRGEEPARYVSKVKAWDKLKAIELLGRYYKMFVDRVEVTGKLTLEQLVTASEDPAGEAPVVPAAVEEPDPAQ